MKNKVILLGLNELNFSFIEYYISKGLLQNFKLIFDIQKPIKTISESKYELLEPWIQWVSIYTGKKFKKHNLFRLGDIVKRNDLSQIFEEIESLGYSVGAVSPFNADNRLKKPSFFIPDPWTETLVSGNFITKKFFESIKFFVNNNARKGLSFSNLIFLFIGFVITVPITNWGKFLKMVKDVNLPGQKAVILDMLLSELFIKFYKVEKPDFAHLFLNSGAHIQHHYMFNSEAYEGKLSNPEWYCKSDYDPLISILDKYDKIIGELQKTGSKIIIATGLHQSPHKKLTYYWRLNKHSEFIDLVKINRVKKVIPRMSRDFLIEFNSDIDALNAEKILNDMFIYNNKNLVNVFSVDNRGDSLFVELTYPHDINFSDHVYSKIDNKIILRKFKNLISFVAIKNGEHNGIGYLTSNYNLNIENEIQLEEINDIIKSLYKA